MFLEMIIVIIMIIIIIIIIIITIIIIMMIINMNADELICGGLNQKIKSNLH